MPSPTNAASNETLVRFARRVSHDLNNFSTVVRTYSELLLSELPPDSPTYADVAEIQRAAESMVQYLARVTRFARAGAMRRVPVDVSSGIAEAVEQFGREHPGRPVSMSLAPGATIMADALWWRDVMGELLLNAHEAAPAGTPLMVAVSATGERVDVSITDTGNGVPVSLGDQVMEPFVSGKQGVRGAGIGLALVAAFLEAINGSIGFERENGTTVTRVEMPVA
ncbi:HAMP domain-containing sensor histidine kinase [Gemmatimonas aurantiaca]|uniref:sensor histidine kinase n=1 Tax=Gemmatimonas aurantiaca TaxID=173480 RepID=UPI00301BEE28